MSKGQGLRKRGFIAEGPTVVGTDSSRDAKYAEFGQVSVRRGSGVLLIKRELILALMGSTG